MAYIKLEGEFDAYALIVCLRQLAVILIIGGKLKI